MLIYLCLVLTLVLSGGYADVQAQRRLHDPNNVHNVEHIKEHMGEYYQNENMTDNLKLDSEEEMEFHYFKLHDYDGNNKLDGLELAAAMTHFHEDESASRAHNIALDDDEMANLVDQILAEDDLNDDGYIDYYEFTNAQRKGGNGNDNDKNAV